MTLTEFLTMYVAELEIVEVYSNFKSNYRGSIHKDGDKFKYEFEANDYCDLKDCEVKSISAATDEYGDAVLEVIVKD